jgi:hypothetical protein
MLKNSEITSSANNAYLNKLQYSTNSNISGPGSSSFFHNGQSSAMGHHPRPHILDQDLEEDDNSSNYSDESDKNSKPHQSDFKFPVNNFILSEISSKSMDLQKNSINRSNDANRASGQSSSNMASKTELFCVICGASANGYNFDAVTCESCKAFFRRNAFRPLVSYLLTIEKDNLLVKSHIFNFEFLSLS